MDRSGIFAGSDPFVIARAWLTEAEVQEPNDANAIALADRNGSGVQESVEHVIVVLDSPGAIKYALLSDDQFGYAILPRYAVEREVQRHELVLIPLLETELKRSLMIVWNKGRAFTPIQRAFIALRIVRFIASRPAGTPCNASPDSPMPSLPSHWPWCRSAHRPR